MQWIRKSAAHICAVIKGILFIGFSIQIILGSFWMGCNLGGIQDFGEPDSSLYRCLFRLFGEKTGIMYLVQMAAAALAGYCLLREQRRGGVEEPAERRRKYLLIVWKIGALLTFPFAMQCHLAILPYSFMGSLYLLMIFFLWKAFCSDGDNSWVNRNRKRVFGFLGLALFCAGMFVILSGTTDAERREKAGRSFEAAMARRIAWPTIWIDHEAWPEELRGITEEILWEVSYCPSNMEDLHAVIENSVDTGTAKGYYKQIAQIAWEHHAPMVIRQIGWDILGYAATPVVFQLQLDGKAYDSCTGRNYEIMRGNTPVLTRYYVDYGCWWFGFALVLTLILTALQLLTGNCVRGMKRIPMTGICVVVSGLLIVLLTARGAGIMDYKFTVAVNELWLIWALSFVKQDRSTV